ncbi:MAG: glycosyltransferase family 1 protein [Burkholderiaceae bacterium]
MSEDSRLRIGLNASALLFPLTGIGQYTKNLAEALVATGEVDLHLFYMTAWSSEIRTKPLRRITKLKEFIKKVVPHPYAVSRFIQQVKFTQGARARGIALYHEPNFLSHEFSNPIVISAHDLSWIRFPETHPPERVAIMNRLFPRCLERADHVITDAAFIRDEVIAEFGVSPDRVTSIPLAARRIFRPRSAAECARVMSARDLSYRRFILCVGTLEPRKNLELMIRTYAAMPADFRRRFPLVLVGMKGWLTSSLEAVMQPLISLGQVRPLGFTSDDDLAALYASAKMLVYPSIYEGFGLPPLEAMASGTPVIVSTRSTLPEVVGSAGIQIDPSDEVALREAMLRLTDDPILWEQQAKASVVQAGRFSWERCAQETVAIYRHVLNRTKS